MSLFSVPPVVMASLTLLVGLFHLALYLNGGQHRQHFSFSLMCLTMSIYCVACAGLYSADTVAQGGEWQRAQPLILNLLGLTMLLFLSDYTGLVSRWIKSAFVVYFVAAIVWNFLDRSTLTWNADIPAIKEVPLPFGLVFVCHEITPGPLTQIQSIIGAFLLLYAVGITIRLYLRGERARALMLLAALSLFAAAVFNDLLIASKVYRFLYLTEYAYMGMVVLMGQPLVAAVLRSSRMQEALQFTQFALDHASDAALWCTPDGQIARVNLAASASLGYTESELLKMNMQDIDPGMTPETRGQLWMNLRSHGAQVCESAYRRKDGTALPVEIACTHMPYKDDEYCFAFARDITQRKAAEQMEHHSLVLAEAIAAASMKYLETGNVSLMAEIVVNQAVRAVGCQFGAVVELLDEEKAQILAVAASGWSSSKGVRQYERVRRLIAEQGTYPFPFSEGILSIPLKDGLTVLTNAPDSHPKWPGTFPDSFPEFVSFLGVPMKTAGHVIGMIALANQPGGFSERHLHEAESFANTAALALRTARSEKDRSQIEEQLRKSQKMEAIGQLAGGIAHDFNNLLLAILGHTDLALGALNPDEPCRRNLEQVRRSAQRAAGLTRQLLAFSRRQVLQPIDLDLNEVISDFFKMLRRVIGENIELDIIPGHSLGTVHADVGQIEQVLMNLVVNARDAMPGGGRITIETQNILIGSEYCRSHPWAKEGRYVLLSVTDTGCGMTPDVQEHIFEPFYTTKEVGKGTGLGLAMVYGIVKQHDGLIQAYSEVGRGSTFKIYLPVVKRLAEDVGEEIAGPIPSGNETILLAEDDEVVRELAVRILENAGYTVITAEDGYEALRLFEQDGQRIHLALLDVVMPRLGGQDVAEHVFRQRPDVKVLLTTGYSISGTQPRRLMKQGAAFIEKPWDPESLLRKVREVLDA